MKRPSYRIEIPKPCHEDWALMTSTDRGKFCASCQKQVVDFTGYTDREIARLLGQSKGELCGRFRDDQLQREITAPETVIRNNPLKVLLSSLLAAASLSPLVTHAQQVKKEVLRPKSDCDNKVSNDKSIPQFSEDNTLCEVNGIVIDSTTNLPVTGAIVQVSGLSHKINDSKNYSIGDKLDCLTELSGKFNLMAPLNRVFDSLTLKIYDKYFFKLIEYNIPKQDLISKDQNIILVKIVKQELDLRPGSFTLGCVQIGIKPDDLNSIKRENLGATSIIDILR